MVLNEFQLLGRDVDRITLYHIWIDRCGRAVDRRHEFIGQGTVIADLAQRGDDGGPIQMAKTGGKAVVVGDLKIEQAFAGKPDRIVDVRLFRVQVVGIQTNTAVLVNRISQRERLCCAIEKIGFKAVQRLDGNFYTNFLRMGTSVMIWPSSSDTIVSTDFT